MASGKVELNEKSDSADSVARHHSEVLVNPDFMSEAIDGENRGHGETMWTSFKSYPWAYLWAFTMCSTTVSRFSRDLFAVSGSWIAQFGLHSQSIS